MTNRLQLRRVGLAGGVVAALAVLGAMIGWLVLPSPITAEARLAVGSQGLYAQQVPGYVDATVALAQTYARFVTDGSIASERSPGVTAIRATAIATTPVIRLQADAKTQAEALAAATKATDALVASVAAASGSTTTDGVAKQLTEANAVLSTAKSDVAAARTSGNAAQLASAENTQLLAQLKVNGLSTAYQNLVATTGSPSTELSVLQKATITTAQSRRPALLGLVAGGLLGLGLLGVWSMRRRGRADSAGRTDGPPEPTERLE